MIIFRKLLQKLFRRDEMPDEKFEINKEYLKEKYGIDKIKIDFLNTKKYDTQIGTKSFTERETIKKLRSDIKKGFLYDDGPNGGDTHFLSDFSHKDDHMLSKKINSRDRLNYRVYRPYPIEDENGDPVLYQKIVFESCARHETNGRDEGY